MGIDYLKKKPMLLNTRFYGSKKKKNNDFYVVIRVICSRPLKKLLAKPL
jgi:hypothetical protein